MIKFFYQRLWKYVYVILLQKFLGITPYFGQKTKEDDVFPRVPDLFVSKHIPEVGGNSYHH